MKHKKCANVYKGKIFTLEKRGIMYKNENLF